jgi:ferric iron reductase protein FhuF
MEAVWNQYRLFEGIEQKDFHISGQSFICHELSDEELLLICDIFLAPDLKVTASLFMKRYSAYIGVLESMSRRNIGLQLSLENVFFICSETQVAAYTPAVSIQKCMTEDRNKWREQLVTQLFQKHIAIMIRAFAKKTKLAASVMWGHVAFYVHVMYRKWIQEERNETIREQLVADFQYLLAASPEMLGSGANNPLQMPFCKMKVANEEILLRRTCCLNYKAGTKGACYTCPRLNEQERIQKLQHYAKA